MGSFQFSEDKEGVRGKKRSNSFLIGHDLFLWSPKGFLTGSSSTPGSVLVGTHFERVNMEVDCNGTSGISCAAAGYSGGTHMTQFHRNRILLREWDLWYFVAPRMSVGISVLWYDAANLNSRLHQAAYNLGICSRAKINAGACRDGIPGDWTDVQLNWRYTF